MSAICSTCEADLDETPKRGFYCASCTVVKLETALRAIIDETRPAGEDFGHGGAYRIALEALKDWPS